MSTHLLPGLQFLLALIPTFIDHLPSLLLLLSLPLSVVYVFLPTISQWATHNNKVKVLAASYFHSFLILPQKVTLLKARLWKQSGCVCMCVRESESVSCPFRGGSNVTPLPLPTSFALKYCHSFVYVLYETYMWV